MLQCRKSLLALTVTVVALTGCDTLEDAKVSGNAGAIQRVESPLIAQGPSPLYDPVKTQFPLPEDAVFYINADQDGTALNGTDPANPVTLGLGFLDGVSTQAPFDIEISTSLDTSVELDARAFVEVDGAVIPNPDQNVFVLPLEYASGDSLFGAENEVPGMALANDFRRARFLEARGEPGDLDAANAIYDRLLETPPVRVEVININGGTNNAVRILPESPLEVKTKYAIALSNDLKAADGTPLVGAPTYQSISNPDRVLANAQFAAFRRSAAPARQQVADFGQLKRDFFSDREESVSIVGFDDVVYSSTITTTGIEDVLVANAAPQSFFQSDLNIELRKDQIGKLISGFYNVSQQPLSEDAEQDAKDINQGIFDRLTDESFRLFNQDLADRITQARDNRVTLTYSDIVTDSDGNLNRVAAFAAQLAVAEVASETKSGDVDTEAGELATQAAEILDLPKAREVRVYRQRPGRQINPAFGQQAADDGGLLGGTGINDLDIQVYEGEIVLPYYMGIPEDDMDGVAITGSRWSAADFGPNVNLPLAITDRVTYRFPFAKKVGEVKVPFIITQPQIVAGQAEDDGQFPVIIYQTALTQDRSAALTMAVATGLLCNADGDLADCFTTITLDLPVHGVFDGFEGATSDRDGAIENGTPSDSAGLLSVNDQRSIYPEGSRPAADTMERHFGFAGDANMQPTPADQLELPEGESPPSGNLFLNFANFTNTQGYMRQVAMDALNVNASLGAIEAAIADCEANGSCTDSFVLETDRVYYLTHSLTGMGGVPVPSVTNKAIDAGNTALNPVQGQAFFNVGSHFTRALENSFNISADLLPGLFAASDGLLAQGRFELNAYFNILQGLLDGVDPGNYADDYRGTNTMLAAIIGDPADDMPLSECAPVEGSNPPSPAADKVSADCTMPNAADDTLFVLGPLDRDVTLEDGTSFPIDSLPAPLAGTEPFGKVMNALNVLDPNHGLGQPFISLFREGSHGNPISAGQSGADPGSSTPVFTTLAIQMMDIFQNLEPSTTINQCDAEQDGNEDCAVVLVPDSERSN
ncbi:MAG: hypothetical protein R3296_09380 [Oleiphilaceae bacterium]|nr:hypothetical protein [Oleiphilaceae bacterium]